MKTDMQVNKGVGTGNRSGNQRGSQRKQSQGGKQEFRKPKDEDCVRWEVAPGITFIGTPDHATWLRQKMDGLNPHPMPRDLGSLETDKYGDFHNVPPFAMRKILEPMLREALGFPFFVKFISEDNVVAYLVGENIIHRVDPYTQLDKMDKTSKAILCTVATRNDVNLPDDLRNKFTGKEGKRERVPTEVAKPEVEVTKAEEAPGEEPSTEPEAEIASIQGLKISARTLGVLEKEGGVFDLQGLFNLLAQGKEAILSLEGIGPKGLEEIIGAVKELSNEIADPIFKSLSDEERKEVWKVLGIKPSK